MRATLFAMLLVGCSPPPTRAQLLDPATCQGCHPQQYGEWAGSMHAYAAADPVFIAMNQKGQRETAGALGGFCVNCHAPMAVREGKTVDGLNLGEVEPALKGVTCFFCHTVDAALGTHNNPLRLASEPTMRGAFEGAYPNSAHQSAYSPLHDRDQLESAKLCGACHDVQTQHGANIERTFSEWQASVYSRPPGGVTCGQCHLPQSAGTQPIATTAGAPERRAHSHAMRGVDVALTDFPNLATERAGVQELLDHTLQTGLCVTLGRPRLHALLDNVAAGHGFPSGAAQDRRVWAEVVAYLDGGVLYRSGATADAGSERVSGDLDAWLMRDCIFDADGGEVHDFWAAASFEGNALPAPVTFDKGDARFYESHRVKTFPLVGELSAEPDRVTLSVWARPISRDVTDALVASGDLDPAVAARLPTFQLGPTLEWTREAATRSAVDAMGLPIFCVSKTGLTLSSAATRVEPRVRCSP
ncbi:MAG: hypothetical protein IPJ65_35945 [Archangiaceae bacterium]|nr:hypothetical protein [Archangiaceae bacterium]